jgi:hypothetical protein
MEKFDLPRFAALMASIGELHGKTVSGLLTELYWCTLERFQWQDVEQALQAHLQNPDTGQYFPKPADVVRFIEGSGEVQALQAWTKVSEALRLVGAYQSLSFDDALIHAVLEAMGGWVKLCAMKLSDMPFVANEFQKRYMGFVLKKPTRYPAYLWGMIELENTKNGYPVKPPLLVGDAQKANQVMLRGGGQLLMITEIKPITALLPDFSQCSKSGD